MKPNNQAIEAAIRYLEAPMSAREQMEQILTAAYAAQFPPSEDYAGLVKWLRDKAESLSEIYPPEAEAADAIEAVLAERDAMIAAIRPHIEAAERERCAKIASGLCESCGGEGWLWAHELGIGLRNDDTKYSCDGQGESIACKIAAAIRSGK